MRWWSRDHRAHHRYVDTDKDPYSATKGFWYAHIGWMLVKQDKTRIGKAEITGASPLAALLALLAARRRLLSPSPLASRH